MMTDEQRSKVAKLKAAIAASDRTTGGVSQAVRGEVLALRQEFRAEGTTARALAAMLGVHETTLSRWGRESGAEAMEKLCRCCARPPFSLERISVLCPTAGSPTASASPARTANGTTLLLEPVQFLARLAALIR